MNLKTISTTLAVSWSEENSGISPGDPLFATKTIAHVQGAVRKVLRSVAWAAPRSARSATVGPFDRNTTFSNGRIWWDASYSIRYYSEVSEGEFDLRRDDRCRDCGRPHLELHAEMCPLRGEDRLIYVGRDNLNIEFNPYQSILKEFFEDMFDRVPSSIPEEMAPSLFQRMRFYKEECVPEGFWKERLEKEKARKLVI